LSTFNRDISIQSKLILKMKIDIALIFDLCYLYTFFLCWEEGLRRKRVVAGNA
jgi:hypothetical protein